jgi:hypothetical protein
MSTKIGEELTEDEKSRVQKGKPTVFEVQVEGYVEMKTPEELKQWQEDLLKHHGIDATTQNIGIACESITYAGRTDACDNE